MTSSPTANRAEDNPKPLALPREPRDGAVRGPELAIRPVHGRAEPPAAERLAVGEIVILLPPPHSPFCKHFNMDEEGVSVK